jgi:AcrR family transcriptional regulator
MRATSRSNSRAALIDAAFEEFTANGYEATTVASIADRAGVTTGALYAHFASKLDLLLATIGLTPIELIDRSVDELASLPRAATADLLAHRLPAAPDDRTLLLLDVIVVARRNPRVAVVLRTGLDAYLAATARAIDAGARSGAVDPSIAATDLSRLFGLLNLGMIMFAALEADPPSSDALAQLADLVLRSAVGDDDDEPEPDVLSRVKTQAAAAARAQHQFEDAVADATRAGHSLRQVGAAAGLSHERVRQLLRKRDSAAQT